MSDENWNEFFSYKNEKKYITLRQYIKLVMSDQPNRKEELNNLIKVYGLEAIDAVIANNYEIKLKLFTTK